MIKFLKIKIDILNLIIKYDFDNNKCTDYYK